jgi:hypothetical protein
VQAYRHWGPLLSHCQADCNTHAKSNTAPDLRQLPASTRVRCCCSCCCMHANVYRCFAQQHSPSTIPRWHTPCTGGARAQQLPCAPCAAPAGRGSWALGQGVCGSSGTAAEGPSAAGLWQKTAGGRLRAEGVWVWGRVCRDGGCVQADHDTALVQCAQTDATQDVSSCTYLAGQASTAAAHVKALQHQRPAVCVYVRV